MGSDQVIYVTLRRHFALKFCDLSAEPVCESEASHWHSKIPVKPRTDAAERRMPLTRQPSVALCSAK